MQHLIVILDNTAKSFCYYPTCIPYKEYSLMDLAVLKKVIWFAQINGMSLNVLVGDKELPQDYYEALDEIRHIFISDNPTMIKDICDILVINIGDEIIYPTVSNNLLTNIIVRVDRGHLSLLSEFVNGMKGRYRRLNIIILDVDSFEKDDFDVYSQQLREISSFYLSEGCSIEENEISVITDRIVLSEMNNCDAGIRHLTVSPEGKLFICPAFYYDNNLSVGDVESGVLLKNKHLLKLDHAPICRKCDAYHCKRCVWLNNKTTHELNTPSHEQCVLSHIERNNSMILLNLIKAKLGYIPFQDIEPITYLDPFLNNL